MDASLTLSKKQTKNAEHSKRWDVAVATQKLVQVHGMSHHAKQDSIFVNQRGKTNDSS